jgi:hypothetical protein
VNNPAARKSYFKKPTLKAEIPRNINPINAPTWNTIQKTAHTTWDIVNEKLTGVEKPHHAQI